MAIKSYIPHIPFYLQDKLLKIGIDSLAKLLNSNYLIVFQQLKQLYPSLNYNTLFDLYCLVNGLPLNSLNYQQKFQVKLAYAHLLPHYTPLPQISINKYLQLALNEATTTTNNNEVPIGAVIVKNDQVIATGTNQTISCSDITQHAEIVAITRAAKILGTHRLSECDLYVTIEPCLMCVGAILHSRIRRLIFGALEPKTGAVISQYRALNNINTNKHTEAIGPIDNDLYAKALQQFFSYKRIPNL
ncbi:MAG: tRNA(adenine34) deaminase [Pseudomonadota bacterium]|nr:tRNA(adenine34) deaminase [Pseudomonadota bacterium]